MSELSVEKSTKTNREKNNMIHEKTSKLCTQHVQKHGGPPGPIHRLAMTIVLPQIHECSS